LSSLFSFVCFRKRKKIAAMAVASNTPRETPTATPTVVVFPDDFEGDDVGLHSAEGVAEGELLGTDVVFVLLLSAKIYGVDGVPSCA
jgi:hypothetical protein